MLGSKVLVFAVPLALSLFMQWRYQSAMPAPFDTVRTVSIPPERIALYPGQAEGASVPPILDGVLSVNKRLQSASRLFQGTVMGSESVSVTPGGELVMVDRYGFVFRAKPSNSTGEPSYQLQQPPIYIGPGRPLGFHMVGEDDLYVCDSLKGLLHVQLRTEEIKVLSNAIHPEDPSQRPIPINYANDLDIAADGSIYFTSCTDQPVALNDLGFYDTMRSYLLSSFRGASDGQLLKWDPNTKRTSVLATGFAYANGVALSADEKWVAVVETNLARIHRHWLKGPHKGKTEIFVDRLPGFPDGISRSSQGGFWVAMVAKMSPVMGIVAPYPWIRQLLSHWAMDVLPFVVKPSGFGVLKLNGLGEPLEALYDPDGSHIRTISAVTESDGKLFLGNLGGDFVSVVHL